MSVNMQHNRRKKKRVNYGVRAVELSRGAKGFGFTISGQQPSILSCIVQGSPAEIAGLRAGDYLVAVNGHNVSKAPHDDVVKLIGNSKGILRLEIAENYYSDSSDEEGLATVRSKKYSHKIRSNNVGTIQPLYRIANVVRDLQTGAMFSGRSVHPNKIQCSIPPPPVSHKRDSEKIVHRTVVGYLGTIDIPDQLHPSSMMEVLKKCIKRLKAEKRTPTTVLLTIHVANIKLTNSENRVVAEYPSYRIIFCNSFSEQDKQYFGILTKSVKDTDDIVSNSCHVFTIYYKLTDHDVHSSTCNVFGFTCTKTSELNVCQEFPDSCVSLIGAIQTLYISDTVDPDANPYESRRHQETASPQPSNISTSTAHSSNSDSGIGFKDDYGSHSDRNIVADFPQRHCGPSISQRSGVVPLSVMNNDTLSGSRLGVRATTDQRWNDLSRVNRSRDSDFSFDPSAMDFRKKSDDNNCYSLAMSHSTISARSEGQSVLLRSGGESTTCPGPSASMLVQQQQQQQGLGSSSVGSLASVCGSTSTMYHDFEEAMEIAKNHTMQCDEMTEDLSLCNKLSPKVYAVSKSFVHSMEDLKPGDDYSTTFMHSFPSKNDKTRPWCSLQEIRKVEDCTSRNCMHGSTESCDKTANCNVHSWASGFEKLLGDPKGLQTFAEFLKKEFSHENIYFWAACERYTDTEDLASRRRLARQIYQRHLSATAAEPVNVDSHAAGQITQELLNSAPADLFMQAQKQVFNLMKFDSYPRFLRSDLYRRCLETGNSVIGTEDRDLSLTSSPSVKLKKSHSDAEDRCRKSILPWHRKNRSKSKDRGESEYVQTPSRSETIYKSFTTIKREAEGNNNEDSISISSSRSSLASWDLALRQSFNKHIINLKYPSTVLSGQEVEVVPSKVLKVDLPSRRIITVVAHKGRTLREVLRPLLNKYGFKLELITIWGEGHPLSADTPAINAPTRLVLTSNNEDIFRDVQPKTSEKVSQGQPTLDEITNKVFEELLVGKSTNKYQYSEGSCKSDDQRSDSSSILSNKFFMRDSSSHGKKKSKSKSVSSSDKGSWNDCGHEENTRSYPPLIAKWRNGVKLQLPSKFDGDDLYEGLKRAQRSRLEDQRGTEINYELPDFLKNKENGKILDSKKMRKVRGTSVNYDGHTKFYDSSEEKQNLTCHQDNNKMLTNGNTELRECGSNSFDNSDNLDGTLVDIDQTVIVDNNSSSGSNSNSPSKLNNNQNNIFGATFASISPSKLSKPPPLPPKPKNLQTTILKSNYIMSSRPFQRIAQINHVNPIIDSEQKNTT
ncbi:regulator of G-protein signaling loco isoform X2 [Leptopilina boulardi]|uniref:regulator of G-protein signaling loco isoform X2 n=1 Tax=Leptopilina boulardi TaxID=63433 RepID=UPI0021F5B915|nr:regulator of G-protein signaling loco isoform X2 [Leptopilina boulardi]